MALHAPISFTDGYPEMLADPYGIPAGIVEAQAFRKGTWGAAFANEMTPADGYVVRAGPCRAQAAARRIAMLNTIFAQEPAEGS